MLKSEYDGDNPVDKKGVNYDDINSALNSLRAAADDAMQRGEIFCCNQTLLQVVDRSGTFEPSRDNEDRNEGRVYVTLKVIGFTGSDHHNRNCIPERIPALRRNARKQQRRH